MHRTAISVTWVFAAVFYAAAAHGLIINTLDNFLHHALGLVIGLAGWYFHARSASLPPTLQVQPG
jgi:hypothetical protein